MKNRAAFDELDLTAAPLEWVSLGRTLADELDRQALEGRGMNAQLVREYVELLGRLREFVAASESPQRGVLASIRDAGKAGAA